MNLLGMKVSNEQLVCCLICFLLGYHFRSLFGMEGFALNELYKAKLTEYAEDVSHTDHKSAKNLIGMEYEDNCDGYNKCVKNYKKEYFHGSEPKAACHTSAIDYYEDHVKNGKDKEKASQMGKFIDTLIKGCPPPKKNDNKEEEDYDLTSMSSNIIEEEEDMIDSGGDIDCDRCKMECFPDM